MSVCNFYANLYFSLFRSKASLYISLFMYNYLEYYYNANVNEND